MAIAERQKPPLIEPFATPEIIADEIVGVRIIDGDVEVVLARSRPACGAEPARREIVGRMILLRRMFAKRPVAERCVDDMSQVFQWSEASPGHA